MTNLISGTGYDFTEDDVITTLLEHVRVFLRKLFLHKMKHY